MRYCGENVSGWGGRREGGGGKAYDEDDFKGEPAAVGNEPAPFDVPEADGVDKGGEEAGAAAKELEDCNAAGALGEGEELDEEGCSGR